MTNNKNHLVGICMIFLFTLFLAQASSNGAGIFNPATGVREEISLNGKWDFLLDEDNDGVAGAWHIQEMFEHQKSLATRTSRSIRVPRCWEEIVKDYEGVAWYGRKFRVPDDWKGKSIRVRFNAVNYIAEIWVNDHVVGRHVGGYTPFEFHLEDLLEYDADNYMIVRVVGPAITVDNSGELLKNEAPHWRGAITGGIWQPVSLIATRQAYLKDVFVQPDIQEEMATIQLSIEQRALQNEELTAQIRVFPWQEEGETTARESMTIKLEPGTNLHTIKARIKNPSLWSPENPALYLVETSLIKNGETIDMVETRFGMREFTFRDNDFYLNGKKFFMKAGFWEGLYPVTLSYPADREIVRKEIRLAKEAGFNTLRPWRKPPAPPILELADEMGILIIDSPPIECMKQWPRLTPKTEHYLKVEVEGMVLRDRNHPSVIIWEIFNEINRPYLTRYKHPMSLVARNLDPTRVVIDESGGQFASDGSYAYKPYSKEPVLILEKHRYLPAPTDQEAYQYFSSFGESDKITIKSEFGYGSLPDLPANMERYRREGNPIMPDYRMIETLTKEYRIFMKQYGLYDIWPDLSALCLESQEIAAAGNKMQAEALRLNPNLDGYAIHAFTGGDWVIGAGILDFWRVPKVSYDVMKEVQQPQYLALRVMPKNVYAGNNATLDVTAIIDKPVTGGQLEVTVNDPAGKVIYEYGEETDLQQGLTALLNQTIKPEGPSGSYQVKAVFRKEGEIITENRFEFLMMSDRELKVPERTIAIMEPAGELEQKLKQAGLNTIKFNPQDKSLMPVLVTSPVIKNNVITREFNNLLAFVRRGGTAVLLNPRQQIEGLVQNGILGSDVQFTGGRGGWVPVNHYVHEHPIFEGVPSKCFMGQEYQNIVPRMTVRGLSEVPIAGALTWKGEDDYRGVKGARISADMVEVPYGEGMFMISTLRLIENLGKDPLADRIMYNLINFLE